MFKCNRAGKITECYEPAAGSGLRNKDSDRIRNSSGIFITFNVKRYMLNNYQK